MIDIDHWHATFHESGGSIYMRMTNDKDAVNVLWFHSPLGSGEWTLVREGRSKELEREHSEPRDAS